MFPTKGGLRINVLGKDTCVYLLEGITLHLASPHTLESASANQAQPMQNTSKIIFFFIFFFSIFLVG